MKTNSLNLPNSVQEPFISLEYRHFHFEYPGFGGIIHYLRKGSDEQEAA
jgi:hypothetical protein